MAQFFLHYLLVMNVVTFVVSIWDKSCAVHQRRRVSERTLLVLSFLGGTAGARLARMVSGHKRLKTGFTVSLNLITFFQIGVAVAAWSGQYGQGGFALDDFALASHPATPEISNEPPAAPKRFGPGS